MKKVGSISFLVAMVMALLATFGVAAVEPYMWVMALFGAVFAVCSLDDSDAMSMIILGVGLHYASEALNGVMYVGQYIGAFSGAMASFMMAAALVIALRWMWNTGGVMGLINKA